VYHSGGIEYTYMAKKEGSQINTMQQYEHDGNIYRLADELKLPERRIIDFSAPVNPLGVSKKVKAEVRRHLKYLHRYPDPDAKRLRTRLGQYHGVDPETIVCGNGSTGLIHLIAKAFNPQKVLIPAATFSVYERACRINGAAEVIYFDSRSENNFNLDIEELIEAIQVKLPAMAFLCNPNDFTGRLLAKQVVKKIADAVRDIRCYLVVDEAYIDFSSGESMIAEVAGNPYLIVLRSMSHYYALAGIRFGYGVFPTHAIGRMEEYKTPYTVNSLAQCAVIAALKDKAYRKESAAVLQREKAFLEKSLRKLGITFSPSDANFYLLRTVASLEFCRHLRSKGILVRDCSDFAGLDSSYLRIAVKSHRENAFLIRELARIMARKG
jgi:threonine-phosphate decarboxylase